MANRLSMADVNAIQTLHQSGHSLRRIAELLGVDRQTVGKYVAAQNPPNAPPGPRSFLGVSRDRQASVNRGVSRYSESSNKGFRRGGFIRT